MDAEHDEDRYDVCYVMFCSVMWCDVIRCDMI